MPRDERPVVYSTEHGDLRKGQARHPKQPVSLPPRQQNVILHRESKGRGGKVVTLVKNLQLNPQDLKELAKAIKQACGSGGTIKGGVIEIQGDQRQKIAGALQALGYKVKIAGG
jgi:translation initiation factor 1